MMNNPWEEIRTPKNEYLVRRVQDNHPLDLFWAKDQFGNYLFFCEINQKDNLQTKLPKLDGIKIQYTDDHNKLVLLLNDKTNWELFSALCWDITHATKEIKKTSSVPVILRRLERWQELLKKERKSILTEESIKGLIGELYFLKNHLFNAFGPEQSIKFWQGPKGFPQDFNVNEYAIEVKCKSGASSNNITITSADQLCPQLPEMFLYVITLSKTTTENEDRINLLLLVKDIRDLILNYSSSIIEDFNDLLYTGGFIDLDLYEDCNYLFIDEKMYKVLDDFPKICDEQLHNAIEKITYSINLSECESYLGKPDWINI